MKWFSKVNGLIGMVFCLALSQSIAAKEELDKVIALVEEDVILESEFNRSYENVVTRLVAAGQKLPEDAKLREQVMDKLIVDSVLYQIAQRAGFRVDDNMLNTAISNIARGQKMTLEQLRQNIESQGQSYELFREDVRKEIAATEVRNAQVRRKIFVSEQEVDAIIELMNKEGEQRNQYHLGHILITVNQSAGKEALDEARAKAISLVEQLRAGADFAQMAIGESQGPNALKGGDFGWRSIAQMPSLFVDSVRQLKVNGISEPIRSGSGYHILKLKEIRGEERIIVNQTHVRHILIEPDVINSEQTVVNKLNKIRNDILSKKVTFKDMAIEHSQDLATANQGGDMGWSNKGTYVPAFEQAMDKLSVGEVSEPIRTQYGYHIIEVLGRRAQDETEEAKKSRARQILFGRKFDEALDSYLRETKEGAYIKILD